MPIMWYNSPSLSRRRYRLVTAWGRWVSSELVRRYRGGSEPSRIGEWGVTSDWIWDGRSNDSSFDCFRIGSACVQIVYIWGGQWARLTAPANMPSTSPVHPNSLVDPATHSPALLELTTIKLTRPVIRMSFLLFSLPPQLTPFPEYLVDSVIETVDFAMGRPSSSSPRTRRPEHAKFTSFVKNVVERAEVNIQTILATLVYIDRAKPHLHIALEEWALERVFLGAIIVASKVSTLAPPLLSASIAHSPLQYLNDSTLKNVHWALCTGVFGKRDVGRIEREYLDVLDFELGITEADILSHHQGLLNAVSPSTLPCRSHRVQFLHPHTPATRASSHSSTAPVPELSPSSDESSSGSASPRTPSTLASSPMNSHDPQQSKSSCPKKSSFTTSALLRSFAIPLPQTAHRRREHSHMSVRLRS